MRTYVLVDLAKLAANFRNIQQTCGPEVEILAVVKADAYGHGAAPVAEALTRAGCDAFAVATVEEGVELREAGVAGCIVLLSGFDPGQEREAAERELTPVVYSRRLLDLWSAEARKLERRLGCHLKVDTGMNRLGFSADADSVAELLSRHSELKFEGLMSHLASAEDFDDPQTVEQTRRFRELLDGLTQRGLRPPPAHLANSAAIAYRPETAFDLVRPGLALYGYVTEARGDAPPSRLLIEPALEWRARLLAVKQVAAGARIGYNGTFRAERPMRIAAVAAGYADGFRRAMRDGGAVLIGGVRRPVVGTVNMDLTLVDVSAPPEVSAEDEAVIIGEGLDVMEMARRTGTVSYDVLCGISGRVARRYRGDAG